MKKSTKKGVYGLLLLILVGVIVYYGSNLFAIAYDDYLIEDDFSIPDPALSPSATNSYCTSTIVSGGYLNYMCKSDKWQTYQDNYLTFGGANFGCYLNIKQENNNLNFNGEWKSGKIETTYLKNLKNSDIKTSVLLTAGKSNYCGQGSSLALSLNDKIVYSLSINEGSNDLLIEMIKDIENENVYHIIINGKEVNLVEISSPEAYLKYTFSGVGSLQIDYLKSRPYFNCEVDTDEVVIKDTFKEGATFDIKDLTYTPVKFCADSYPVIKRSFDDKGVRADIMGQLTKKIVTGQSITVEPNTAIEVYYIADYKEGMGTRCGLDEAYNPTLKLCSKIITEEEDVLEFINEKKIVIVGKNDILFKDSIQIADKTVTLRTPTCTGDGDKVKTSVSYGENDFEVNTEEEIALSQYFNLFYTPQTNCKAIEDSYTLKSFQNYGIIRVKSDDVLMLSTPSVPMESYFVIKGSTPELSFKITNSIGKFEESGIQVKLTRKILTSQEVTQMNIPFKSGTNDYSLPIDSTTYGKMEYEITPYYKIGDVIIFDNEKLYRNFEVVDEVPADYKFKSDNVVFGWLQSLWNWIKGWFA